MDFPSASTKENIVDKLNSIITLTEQKSGDTPVRPENKCQHSQLRSFTFSDGQTIHMCPSCTKFDGHRRAVLAGTRTRTARKQIETKWTAADRYLTGGDSEFNDLEME
jgi:hypothetical protein